MTAETIKLRNPPIVEAILDVDCEFAPNFDLGKIEAEVRKTFEPTYPSFSPLHNQEFTIQLGGSENASTPKIGIQAYQFRRDDGRQIVQVRKDGFSFNRLAPYSSLDDYLPEIKRTWSLYIDLIPIVNVRAVRLRYINRLRLPMGPGVAGLDLDDYFKIGPRSPDDKTISLSGFVIQLSAVDMKTGELIGHVLATEPASGGHLPVILDIAVTRSIEGRFEPSNWGQLLAIIASLRGLKNRVFVNTLTDQCIKLYQ